MRTSERLRELLHYYYSSRRAGHTELLINGVAGAQVPFFLLTHTHSYGDDILKKCKQMNNGRVVAWSNADFDRLRGTRMPIAIDNSAMISILADCIDVVVGAEKETAEAQGTTEENMKLKMENRRLYFKLSRVKGEASELWLRVYDLEREGIVDFIKRKLRGRAE